MEWNKGRNKKKMRTLDGLFIGEAQKIAEGIEKWEENNFGFRGLSEEGLEFYIKNVEYHSGQWSGGGFNMSVKYKGKTLSTFESSIFRDDEEYDLLSRIFYSAKDKYEASKKSNIEIQEAIRKALERTK